MRALALLWYILNGVPFSDAMSKGHWTTPESFHLYLRRRTQILVPHLETSELDLYHELHECAREVRVTEHRAVNPTRSGQVHRVPPVCLGGSTRVIARCVVLLLSNAWKFH